MGSVRLPPDAGMVLGRERNPRVGEIEAEAFGDRAVGDAAGMDVEAVPQVRVAPSAASP